MTPQEPPAGAPFVVGASPTARWALCQSTLNLSPRHAHPLRPMAWQADARQTHTLQAWDAQQRRWEKLRARLAAASTSQTSMLVMDRGEEERRKTEAWQLDALTQPLEMQCGPAAWACSLRDNWTQWVHVGHPLWSGLTGLVRHAARAQQLAIVRRQPVHSSEGRKERTTGHGIHHDVDFLAVHGFGLERMLRERCAAGLALPQVVRHLELTGRADVAQRLVEAAQAATATAREQQAEAAPPADEPVDEEAPFLECCVAPQPGLQLSPLMLSFRGRMLPKSEGSAASLMVRNTGSCSLYYTWQLADSTDPGAASSFMPLPWSGPRPGVLLPGETRVIAFRFCPQHQGTAREIWQMRTAPPVDVRNSAVMLEGIARLGRAGDDAQQAASCDAQRLAEARRCALMEATDAFTMRLKQAEALMSMA
jgi:MYCBP-associated protein family